MDVTSISSQNYQPLSSSKQVNLKSDDVITWSEFQSQVKDQSTAQRSKNEVALIKTPQTESPGQTSSNQVSVAKPGDEEAIDQQAQPAAKSETGDQTQSTNRGGVIDRVV